MDIKMNDQHVDVWFDQRDLAIELIKMIKDSCKCKFDENEKIYDELVKLINKRKKEPIDLSCIE